MNYQPHQQYRRLVECNSYHLECFLPTKLSKNPRLPKEFRIFWTERSRTCTQCPCRYVFLFKTNEPEIFMASRCYFGGSLLLFFCPVVGQKNVNNTYSLKKVVEKCWGFTNTTKKYLNPDPNNQVFFNPISLVFFRFSGIIDSSLIMEFWYRR